jgi:hypothetical protein
VALPLGFSTLLFFGDTLAEIFDFFDTSGPLFFERLPFLLGRFFNLKNASVKDTRVRTRMLSLPPLYV